jgi:hypothetical protein
MKNVLSHIGVSAAALFLFGIVPAQAQEAAKADIPFAFHTNMAAYQSGTYDVKKLSSSTSALVLTSEDTRKSSFAPMVVEIDATAKTLARGPVLVFKCEAGDCALTEVWTATKGYSISHSQVVEQNASTTRIVALVKAAR